MGACVNTGDARKSMIENRGPRNSINKYGDGEFRLARKTYVPGQGEPRETLDQGIPIRNTYQAYNNDKFLEMRQLSKSMPLKHRNTVGFKEKSQLKPHMLLMQRKQTELKEKKLKHFQKAQCAEVTESHIYGKIKQNLILKTIQILANESPIRSFHMSRYDYPEIRNFLKVSDWDPHQAARLIYSDIEWRNKTLPLNSIEISNILRSKKIIMQGTDKVLNPCIYVKPNFIALKNSIVPLKDYFKYFVYLFEYVLPELERREKTAQKVTIIVDLEEQDFRIDVIEIMQEIFMLHYPGRLNKIFILNISLTTIDQKVQQKFQQSFYQENIVLLADRYPENLLLHFYAQELSEHYGGIMMGKYDPEHIPDYKNLTEYIIHEFKNHEFRILDS